MLRTLMAAALASALVYAVMIALSDGPQVVSALRDFPLSTFAIMLVLGLACSVVRAIRWGMLMRVVGYPVSIVDALYLHLSGQTMSISPGRVGEVLKPWLAREVSGLPLSRGIALVFTERVADLIAVCILSLGGLSVLGGGSVWLLVGLGAIVVGTALASSKWFHRLTLGFLSRQTWAARFSDSATAISETVQVTLDWRVLLWSVPSSALAWGFEGVGFVLCVEALGFSALDTASAVSVYAVSTIVGAFTFLPGGIGLTEASMAGILVALGMAASAASVATLLTRLATMWWAVALGWVTLLTRPVLFKRLLSDREAEEICG